MSRQELRDKHHKVVGYIETESDGKQVIRDVHHSVKGYYDPKTNKTRDEHHAVVGEGNLLTSLISIN